MLLHQFHSRFPIEEACIEYFKTVRMQQGVPCPECKGITHKWLKCLPMHKVWVLNPIDKGYSNGT